MRSGDVWPEQAYLKAPNAQNGDIFGRAVSISADGNSLAVGASGEMSGAQGAHALNDPATDALLADNSGGGGVAGTSGGPGAVYLFVRDGATWQARTYFKPNRGGSPSDMFGDAVSLSADGLTLAVGAQQEDGSDSEVGGDPEDDETADSGAAYVFTKSGSVWSDAVYLKASHPGDDDRFGYSVSLSTDGDRLLVGAPTEDGASNGSDGDGTSDLKPNSGAAYAYLRVDGVWRHETYLKPSTPSGPFFGSQSRFGYAVAVSANALNLAVASSLESGGAMGINGSTAVANVGYSGAAYVFVP